MSINIVSSKIKKVIGKKTLILTKHDYGACVDEFHSSVNYQVCNRCYLFEEQSICYEECGTCYFTFDPIDQLLEELKNEV